VLNTNGTEDELPQHITFLLLEQTIATRNIEPRLLSFVEFGALGAACAGQLPGSETVSSVLSYGAAPIIVNDPCQLISKILEVERNLT
jgi:hypothetical protein